VGAVDTVKKRTHGSASQEVLQRACQLLAIIIFVLFKTHNCWARRVGNMLSFVMSGKFSAKACRWSLPAFADLCRQLRAVNQFDILAR